ncbi:MAG: phytanoyl-CoA dioxygenase family protein [Candidatus Rokubacteria bacterium]|nr:phytanoyl-CoA dioxygenase family protein [Candidatus Rokubacteria bacterium]
MSLTEKDLTRFENEGYLLLGRVVGDDQLKELLERIDDLMLGRVRYPGMFFQREGGIGQPIFAGPSRDYRKVKDLEYDDRFLAFLQNDTFRALAERYIGPRVACMRAMLMNKPARIGGVLAYHQDISEKWEMTIPPTFTIWTALDPATRANGCMEIVPRSHRHGRIGTGHMLSAEEEARYAPAGSSVFVELDPGEAIVFDNALLHRSGPNTSDIPRRAFTVCLLDAKSRHTKTGKPYPIVFGSDALNVDGVRKLSAIPPHVYE